jgi:ribonuclease P protein component
MSSFQFLPCHHLRRPSEFRQVFDRRRSVSDEALIIYGKENELPHLRLGMSVSRKFGQATHRNRLRRLIREAFRLTRPELPPGLDLVVIPRKADEPTLDQLAESFRRLVPQLARRLAKESKRHVPVDQKSGRRTE